MANSVICENTHFCHDLIWQNKLNRVELLNGKHLLESMIQDFTGQLELHAKISRQLSCEQLFKKATCGVSYL